MSGSTQVIGPAPVIAAPLTGELCTTRTSTARFYRPQLDSLRFFAFFLVFLQHALPQDDIFYSATGVPSLIAPFFVNASMTGMFGVDVFFVLSSYLITELLLREKERFGQLHVGPFYVRRMLRIWPLYFTFLGLAFGLQWFAHSQQFGWRAAAAFSLLAGNWWVVFQGFPHSIVFPLWSVSIEEQFYLAWPPVVRRLSERGLTIAGFALLAIASSTRIYLSFHYSSELQFWCNTFARLDPIAVGILIAVYLRGESPKLRLPAHILFIAGLSCLALAGSFFSILEVVPRVLVGYPIVALGAGMMLLSVLGGSALPAKGVTVFLGRISYGLYVFHPLGLLVARSVVPYRATRGSFGHFLVQDAIALGITVLMATASFYWLESPFLTFKKRYTYVASRP